MVLFSFCNNTNDRSFMMGYEVFDPETGEVPFYSAVNSETGEVEICDLHDENDNITRGTFKIPQSYFEHILNDNEGNINEMARLLFMSPNRLGWNIIDPQDYQCDDYQSNDYQYDCEDNIEEKQNESNSDKKKDNTIVHPLIDPVIQYTLNVVNVAFYLGKQYQRPSLKKLKISDIYYQSLLKSFFRHLVPFMSNNHLKRKGIKYGLHCVKRIRVF
ncbi:uncharacterized protein [Onthophagus taurus]|uniref:uncharacterized protein n=1 Tax=Onthophagus taurus TaxID=166361 RepID=UPI0039BE8D6D